MYISALPPVSVTPRPKRCGSPACHAATPATDTMVTKDTTVTKDAKDTNRLVVTSFLKGMLPPCLITFDLNEILRVLRTLRGLRGLFDAFDTFPAFGSILTF